MIQVNYANSNKLEDVWPNIDLLSLRCMEENTPILEELITLRQKQAELLGYKNHAHYVLEERMAKNPENVAQFLTNLSEKLQPLWKDEQVIMQKFKKEEVSTACPHIA